MRTSRHKKRYKIIAVFIAVNLLTQVFAPGISYALTSGPSMPEVQSFEPVGTTEMVDVFSGDFTYNIPLFELPGPAGGYPVNLHYNSGITMDQEASWVGLGWNINPGTINRQMRGLPDEFNGDLITTFEHIKPNTTYGIGFGGNIELAGGDTKLGLGLSVGMSFYYNNYKGIGYSFDQGISISQQMGGDGIQGGVGLNLKLDSQEGVGVSASLSVSQTREKCSSNFNVGIGLNSRSGTSMSAGANFSKSSTAGERKDKTKSTQKKVSGYAGGSSNISFFNPGYTPSNAMPMDGRNISLQFKIGATEVIAYEGAYISGFYTTQYYKNDEQDKQTPAYGYLNLQNAGNNTENMKDFNREKDGMIKKNTPNLGIPSLTCDLYTATGQGMAGMFRSFRNDQGAVYDPHYFSETAGGALDAELGVGELFEFGVDLSVNYTSTKSGRWEGDNPAAASFTFKDGFENEPAYFKMYGEHTTDDPAELAYIGNEDAYRLQLSSLNGGNAIENGDYNGPAALALPDPTGSFAREPRNSLVGYTDNNSANGMYVINTEGVKYEYMPVSNTAQVECQYASGALNDIRSSSGQSNISNSGPVIPIIKNSAGDKPKYDHKYTNEYIKKTTMPAFAYSYLIKSITGPDYIDADEIVGPSQGDLGYWVKFNYNNHITGYQWRVPFTGANYLSGHYCTFEDDQGAYTYGTKEIYYLTSIETKTHQANFHLSNRNDGYGVSGELQNNNTLGTQTLQKIDSIRMFSKNDLVKPLKAIHFEYSYELCPGIYNHISNASQATSAALYGGELPSGSTGGKLTLKKVWFTFQKNNRGSLSPYEFTYNQTGELYNSNPRYNPIAYDRWGNYKPLASTSADDVFKCVSFPYTQQFDQSDPNFKSKMDAQAAVWNLKSIKIPSGATIDINYESDDYAYVQNKIAGQMFEIYSLNSGNTSDGSINHPKDATGDRRRVYFKLEHPLSNTLSSAVLKTEINKYTEGLDRIYYKVYMKIRKTSDNLEDFVSGYADIEDVQVDLSSDDGTNYTRGYVQLAKPYIGADIGDKQDLHYHPFSVAAWSLIRSDEPLFLGPGPFDTSPNDSKSGALGRIKSLVGIVGEILSILEGYNNYAFSNDWGEAIFPSKSMIRLNSPDKIKLGGGVRVKQITLTDNWSNASGEANSKYGQVYSYDMVENGTTISSGVASYEPMIGGDENPLRTAKQYTQSIPMNTDNNLYFEYPVNESYYPGSSVGYRKVTVKSLATAYQGTTTDYPSGIVTSGATVYEFYTSKEFPVISKETSPSINEDNWFIPIPLIGQLSSNSLTASQGYCTVLNDMHGKPKKSSTYKQDGGGNILYGAPESSVETLYSSTLIKMDDNPVHDYYVLNNTNFPVLVSDNGVSDPVTAFRAIGQDYEFFADMRECQTTSDNGGIAISNDFSLLGVLPLDFPFPWPNFGYANTDVRVSVINKIIHKAGIVTGTIAKNEASTLVTQNKFYDNETGVPLLTIVTNNFDDPIYNYDIPAYFGYNQAGPAYKNINKSITITGVSGGGFTVSDPGSMVAGDVLISGGQKIVLTEIRGGTYFFSKLGTTTAADAGTYTIIKSGRRNLITTDIGNIKTLGDKNSPTLGNPILDRKSF